MAACLMAVLVSPLPFVLVLVQWLEADVLEVRADGTAFVHFRNFASKFDKWVSPTGGEVRQYGPYRLSPKGNRGVARKASLAPGQLHVRHIEQLSTR